MYEFSGNLWNSDKIKEPILKRQNPKILILNTKFWHFLWHFWKLKSVKDKFLGTKWSYCFISGPKFKVEALLVVIYVKSTCSYTWRSYFRLIYWLHVWWTYDCILSFTHNASAITTPLHLVHPVQTHHTIRQSSVTWTETQQEAHQISVYQAVIWKSVLPKQQRHSRSGAVLVSSWFTLSHGVEKLCHSLPNGNCLGRWDRVLSACWCLKRRRGSCSRGWGLYQHRGWDFVTYFILNLSHPIW